MDHENSFYTIMRGVFAGCGVLFVLLLALFILTSLTTGQSMFAPEIVKLFQGFLYSLGALDNYMLLEE